MRSVIFGFFLVLAAVIVAVLYDANRYFTSSWAVRAYYHFYSTRLDRLAEALEKDADVRVAGIAVNGIVSVSPRDGVIFDDETQASLDAKYDLLLRALYPNPFLVMCNGWFNAKGPDGGAFCIGWRTHYLTVWRGWGEPRFHLKHWSNGVGDVEPCRKPSPGDTRSGTCDMVLSERWTIHYEWFPWMSDLEQRHRRSKT